MVCESGFSMNAISKDKFINSSLHMLGFTPLKSSTKIAELVNTTIGLLKKEVKEDLEDQAAQGERFRLKVDEWTSISVRRFLNVFLTGNSMTYNLGLVPCEGSMTAEILKELIVKRLNEFSLSLDHISGVTTGASLPVHFLIF
jgi:hypothetical protein